ncbi:unnamed protein product [Amoebophrya sp. A25]|nr:unnamed protein product [Amoebophrya sp. A25]|eukprot:GSA25T00018393001.1
MFSEDSLKSQILDVSSPLRLNFITLDSLTLRVVLTASLITLGSQFVQLRSLGSLSSVE